MAAHLIKENSSIHIVHMSEKLRIKDTIRTIQKLAFKKSVDTSFVKNSDM